MASQIPGRGLRLESYGLTVVRATGALPQSTTGTLFNVTGGRILLTSLAGSVTTAVQAQATTYKLVTLSTTGAVANDICATVDLTGAVVGTILGITGVRTDAMLTGSSVPTPNELVVTIGAIRATTVASSTGAIQWTLTYIPLDDGAVCVAA